jgi:hypothetical protein
MKTAVFDDDITGAGTKSNGYYSSNLLALNGTTEILGPGRLSRCSWVRIELNKLSATSGVLTIYESPTQDFTVKYPVATIDVAAGAFKVMLQGPFRFLRGEVTTVFDSGVHVQAIGMRA